MSYTKKYLKIVVFFGNRYLPPIVRDGFKNQRDNPSVIVDVSKQNTVLREQIFFLKSISKKLQHSYNTIDVYWFEEGTLIIKFFI